MGRIVEYVVLLSNLSLLLGAQYAKTSANYGREKEGNFTEAARQHLPREQNFLTRKALPKQMSTSLGLHAYASEDFDRSRTARLPRRNVLPPFSQGLYPRRNSKTLYGADFSSQKLSKLNDHGKWPDDSGGRRHQKEARNVRYQARRSGKICDPCNSVPWVPLLKVPDSYRQQRTRFTELHPTPQQNFDFDYHAYASDTQNILLPPVPLSPPVFDGTISSSFGLPIGNIPTSHGLLAPIHPLGSDFNRYAINTIDYSSSFNYYTPHGLLENNNFPELSPVPVVPIHDSGQFYQFDSSIPDLVPPPSKDVSKVVLTISEEQHPHNHKKNPVSPESSPPGFVSRGKEQNLGKDLGRLEIIKSIPLAEFTSSVQVPQQDLPLYPPLQSEFPTEQHLHTKNSDPTPGFLVPPPVKVDDAAFRSNKTKDGSEYLAQETAPRPLTSPSLSWLFSDHSPAPKTPAPVSPPVTDAQEIASVVNNELLPVSSDPPHPIAATKSKKIQIIIPYTTRGKSGHDDAALESVRHEVFQPPRESATSVLPQSERKVAEKTAYLTEMQHIIATNIRDLLRGEIEKARKDQNYPLQNNIDNWTALEYSNHKTPGTKAPKEIIAQALAVTSIPGTSISHLLLPSKKIPNEYFVTTPLPVYDEPSTLGYRTHNSSVNSRPFTARPYATTNVYNPSRGVQQQSLGSNHESNYTDVERGRVNIWGRLNENLVLPEARTRTRVPEPTTPVGPIGSERLEIVTPVSAGPRRNRTTASFRRTTRHAGTTESPTGLLVNSTKLEKVTFPLGNSSREAGAGESVAGKGESVSINDIFPFRNRELPWESVQNSSQPAPRMARQRNSLIKQVKVQRAKA